MNWKVFAVTVAVGYIFGVVGAAILNFPDLGTIAAIATVGSYILDAVQEKTP